MNQFERKEAKKPVENHQTAAWAGVEKMKPESRVAQPHDERVLQAKEYVDENEK